MVNIKFIIENFGTVKRYCNINNMNYKSFCTAKNYNFQNKKGMELLDILLKDNLITVNYYNKCTELFNMKGV